MTKRTRAEATAVIFKMLESLPPDDCPMTCAGCNAVLESGGECEISKLPLDTTPKKDYNVTERK